eukprot:5120438-Pleurochrysis_carterae.AAC.1
MMYKWGHPVATLPSYGGDYMSLSQNDINPANQRAAVVDAEKEKAAGAKAKARTEGAAGEKAAARRYCCCPASTKAGLAPTEAKSPLLRRSPSVPTPRGR